MKIPSRRRKNEFDQQGFTYLAVLCAMTLLGLASTAVMQYVSQQAQREREQDLLQLGQTFVQAISTYYMASPGTIKKLPQSLEDLLDDKRQVVIRRYLREIHSDPVTGKPDWDLVRASDGGILGVRSHSSKTPIRNAAVLVDTQVAVATAITGMLGYRTETLALLPAQHYSEWAFVYQPPLSPKPGFGP